jgi:hypothetical protein
MGNKAGWLVDFFSPSLAIYFLPSTVLAEYILHSTVLYSTNINNLNQTKKTL